MRSQDLFFFIFYCGLIVLLGLWAGRSARRDGDYFLAGKRGINWFFAGISVMVTAFSAVNFVAFPTEVYKNGLYVLVALPGFFVSAWFVNRFIIPLFGQNIKGASAYGMLEDRFSRAVRLGASAFFILWKMAWMSVALFATSRILASVSGWNPKAIMIFSGLFATFYTTLGGLRAVVLTDVAQFCVLCSAIVFGVYKIIDMHGIKGILDAALSSGTFKPFVPFDPAFISFNPTVRISLWSGLLGTLAAFCARYGADQTSVQRYIACKSVRDSQKALWLNAFCAFGALVLLAFVGVGLRAFTADLPALQKAQPIAVLGAFFKAFPVGFTGLVVAGLAAATNSSLDSGLNSCCTAICEDFFCGRKKFGGAVLGAITFVLGGFCILGAFWVGSLGSVFVIVNKLVNALGTPLLGVFILAFFRPGTRAFCVLGGLVSGVLFGIVFGVFVKHFALHYYALFNLLVTLGCGIIYDEIASCISRFGRTA